MNLRAVAFDVDGTLYPNRTMYLKSVPFFFRNAKLVVHYGKVRAKLRKIRPITDFYRLQSELLAESMKIEVSDAESLVCEQIYDKWENVLLNVKPYRGLREAIDLLRKKNYRLAVLSDFPVKKKLNILELNDFWDYESSSEQVGYLKPNPEPFLDLAEELGLSPEEILYVGNNYDYDVLGAVNAGMAAAHLARFERKDTKAVFTFSSYREFIKKMQDLNLL